MTDGLRCWSCALWFTFAVLGCQDKECDTACEHAATLTKCPDTQPEDCDRLPQDERRLCESLKKLPPAPCPKPQDAAECSKLCRDLDYGPEDKKCLADAGDPWEVLRCMAAAADKCTLAGRNCKRNQ